jgi:uncharacterized protein (DUF362 family)
MSSKDVSRRKFLSTGAKAGAALAASGMTPLEGVARTAAPGVGQITRVVDSAATSGFSTINSPIVEIMMDAGIKGFTGQSSVGEAWKSLFPGITASSVIGIKINLIYPSGLPSHPEVVDAIAAGLVQMDFGGTPFPANNIIVWDRYGSSYFTTAGYTYNTGPTGVRVFGTPEVGYDTTSYNVNGVSTQLSRILINECDFLINVPVIKDHGMAGMTGSLKNTYGMNSNPGSLHATYCNPYIAHLFDLAPIRDKTKVVVCDGLYGLYSGGPTGGWTGRAFVHNSLYISTDPVAVDKTLLDVINQERVAHSFSQITTAYHIQSANDLGLGTNDPGQISVTTIVDPSSAAVDNWKVY